MVWKRPLFVAIWVAVSITAGSVGLAAVNIVQDAVLGTQGVATLTSTEVSQELLLQSTHSAVTPTGAIVGPTAPPAAMSRPAGDPTFGSSPMPPTPSATQRSPAATYPSTTPDTSTVPAHTPEPSSSPTATHSPTQRPTPSPSSTSSLIYSAGGSVVAQCTGPQVRLVSSSPAQGYQVTSANYGPAPQIKVVFRSIDDGQEIELGISCHNGTPADDGGDSVPDQ